MVKDPRRFTAAGVINDLTYNKVYFSPIIFWPYCEVNPIMPLGISLDEKLIKVPLSAISNIEEDIRIAKRLLHPDASYIHGATR